MRAGDASRSSSRSGSRCCDLRRAKHTWRVRVGPGRPLVESGVWPHHVPVPSRPVMVCVVSSHPIVAAGVRALLSEHTGTERFSLVADHADADVVVYDAFNLAPVEGLGDDPADRPGDREGELRTLIAAHPGRVLVLSRLLQPGLTARALAAGAVAPVSISAHADELIALVE